MGEINLDNTGSGGAVTLSSDGTSLLLDGSAIGGGGGGGGADLYAANESSPAAQPSATGGNAIAIGDTSQAGGDDGVAIGVYSWARQSSSLGLFGDAQSISSIAIGAGSVSTANYAAAVGRDSFATAASAVSLGKSRASGTESFAAAITSNSASYGSIGQYGIAIGYLAKASALGGTSVGYGNIAGTYATAIGYLNTSTSQKSAILGSENVVSGNGGVCIGQVNYVQTAGGVAIGKRADARQNYQIAFAAGYFAANGDAQGSMYILRAATTDATPTVLTTTNAAGQWYNQITAQSDSCITFDGTITAMQNGAQSYASWRVEGLLVNDGGTTTLANSATTVIDNQSSWGMALSADNTNNSLAITVTGEASHNIRWVANIRTSEVIYA
jgi:hypothetical protein